MSKKKQNPLFAAPKPADEAELKRQINALRREIRAKEKEQAAYERELRRKWEPEVRKLVRYARGQRFEWYERLAMFPAHYQGGGEDEIVEWLLSNTVRLYVGDFGGEHINPLSRSLSEKRRELRELQ
jgi:ribosomal protein S15P/S13E